VGKWHLGFGTVAPADYARPLVPGPNAAGFDESFVLPASLDMPPYVFVENERAVALPGSQIAASRMRRHGGEGFWRAGAIAPGFRHADVLPAIVERASKIIARQERGRPFLLYVPLSAPHTPWLPADAYRNRSQAGHYGDFVAQVDAGLGRLLNALAASKLDDQTLVIFTSDNGAHWGPGDIAQWDHRANAAWRGQKADLWEGGHRVPFIVRWPGVVKPAGTSQRLVSLTDVLATVAEVLGRELAAGEAEDSFSFLSALDETARASHERSSVVHHSADGTFAIRQGPWKLATKLGSHGFSEPKHAPAQPGGPAGQLYQLALDPGETRNRWLTEPETVARLEALLSTYQQQGYSRPQNRQGPPNR
jgi:arylsulfatase A-like enzyme